MLRRSKGALIALALLLPFAANATHIVGGTLTYVYNGADSYTVTLILYRDCGTGNTAYPANVPVTVLQGDGTPFPTSRNFTLLPTGIATAIPPTLPPCATMPNPAPCAEQRIYQATVTLAAADGGMHLYASQIYRNGSIVNITNPGTTGETFYTFIPCHKDVWKEYFTLPNNTTVDNGATAWSTSMTGTAPLPTAQVNANQMEVISQNSTTATTVIWASQVINIAAFTSGVNVYLDYTDPAGNTLENSDSIKIMYSLNGGPSVIFPTNGQQFNDFNATFRASATALIGNTLRIFVRIAYGANSPNDEIYRFDKAMVYDVAFMTNNTPVFSTLPPLLFCATNPFNFSQGATDADGDSLAYSMYTPYTEAAPVFVDDVASFTPCTWVAGYGPNTPFNSGGPNVTLNPTTGQLSGVANSLGKYVFGVKCSEYRNSKLVSEVVRDYEVNTVTCPPFVPPAPTVGSNSPLCVGATLNLTASNVPGATYSWVGPNGFTSGVQNPSIGSVTLAAAGTYSVYATVSGCTGPAGTGTVVVNPVPVAPTPGSNSPICAGSTLNLTSNNVPGATYNWTGPNSFSSALQNPSISNATVAATGTYSLTVTVNGCTSPVATVSVTVSPIPPAPTAGSNSPICAGSTLNLTASNVPGATYAWTGPNGFTSALQNPSIANATIAASGTYSVTATVAGCTGPAGTVTVVVNPAPVAPTAGSNSPVCVGTTLNLTASNIPGATYNWTGPNGFTSTTQNPSITNVTLAAAGTYTVTATVAGCTGPGGTVTVVVNPTPVAPTAGSNSPICAGSTLNLTASNIPGATYNWTGPNGFTSTLQNPSISNATIAASGTYSVTATVGGCTGPAGTVVVTVNAIPATPAPTSNSPVCQGTTLNLFTAVVPGATYNWTGPNGFTSALQNPSITNVTLAAAGTYSLTITVAGCTGAAGTVTVVVNPTPPAPTAGSNSPLCVGATLNLTASNVPGATYAWTGPNGFTSTLQNPSISNVTLAMAGVYSVRATVNGCQGPAGTVTVVINPVPVAPTAGSNSPLCTGMTLNLTCNNVPGATYAWTGPNSFSSALQNPTRTNVTVADAGVYSVTVTVNGCTSPAGTVTVTINSAPATPTLGSNSPVCVGQTLNLTSNFVSGATYAWTGPNGFTSALQNPSITNVTLAAAGTYSLVINNGCASPLATITVVVNPTPAAPVAGSNSPICAGSTLNLTASNIPGATYSWVGPNSFSSTLQNPSISNATIAATGTYTVYAVSVAGCVSAPATVNVVVNPIPPAPTAGSNSPICQGQTLNLTASTVPGATYNWSGPNSFSSTLQNPSILNASLAAAGTYTVTATVAGCTGPGGTVTVIVNPTPIAPTAGSNSPLCVGSTLNLTASNIPGATYSWVGPNSFTSGLQNPSVVNVTLAAAGTYTVYAISAAGCVGPGGTVTVVVNPVPVAPTAGSNSPLCVGMTLNLTCNNVPGATYAWTGPNGFTSALQNPTRTNVGVIDAGVYSVTVTVNGCTSPAGAVTVTINSAPATPTLGSNSPICTGQTLNLTSNFVSGATYAWTGPNGFTSSLQNPSITNVTLAAAGTYSLVINNGCASPQATITVVVNPTPAAPTLSSNSPVCIGNTLNLFSNNVPGGTYNWSGPNGFTSGSQNPSIPGVTLAAAGTYSLTITSAAGCTSPQSTINVVIGSPAIVNAGPNQTVCANNISPIALNGTSSTGSGTWSTSGTGTFTPNPNTLNASYNLSPADIASGSVTLTLTSTNNAGCAPVTSVIVITISPAPTVNAGPDQTVCANNAVVTLNGSFTVSSGGIWSTNGTGVFAPNNTAMNGTYTPSAADTTAGTVTIYLATTGNGTCLAVMDSMVITITPAPVVNAGASTNACINNPNTNLSGTSSTGTGIWSSSGTGSFNPNNTSLNTTYIPSGADISAGSVIITFTSTGNGNCNAVVDTLIITYTPPPIVSAGTDVTVCANNAGVVLNGNSNTGSGSWTSSGTGTFTPNNNTLNATYNPSAADTAAGTVTLTLTSTNNGGCLAVTDQVVITITPAPTVNAGPDQSVCANNANTTLNGSFTVATGGQWSSSGTGSFSPNNTTMNGTYIPSNADTAAGTVTIYLTSTGNGQCLAVVDSMVITITNAPTVFAGNNIIACKSSPNTPLNGNSSTGSGTWTSSGTGIFSPNPNVTNPTYIPSTADTSAGTVTLIFTSTANGGCNAVSDTLVITYQNTPTVNAGSNQTVCANNANVVLNATSSTGTGIWSTNGTGTFTPNNTTLNATYVPSAADTAAGTVTLTFTSTNGCTPISQSIVITITPAPVVDAGPDIFVCINNPNATLNGSVTGGATTGIWTSNGTGTFNPDNLTLNATYIPSTADTTAGSVILVLTSTNNGNCLAESDTVVITYTQPPVVDAGPDQTSCANNAVQLNGVVTGGNGTGIWTTPNGTGVFNPSDTSLNATYTPSNADTLTGTIILIFTSTNNGGCFADADTVLINVTPGPVVNAGPDQTVCANNGVTTLNGSVYNATGGIWSSNGTGIFSPNNTTLNATYTPSAADTTAGTVTIYLTSTGNGLCSAVTDSMIITITPAPKVDAGPDIYICQGSTTASLNGSVTGGATTGVWTTLGSGTFSPNNTALNGTYNLSNADTTAGIVTLILTSTNNGNCMAESDTVVIHITSIPVTLAGNDTSVCANNANIVLNGSVIGGSGTGVWTTSGTGSFTPDSITLNAGYQPSASDIASGSVILVLTATQACQPISDTIVITFTPAPVVNAGPDQTICAGAPVQLNGTVAIATGGTWSSSGTGTFVPNNTTLNATYIPSPADTLAGTVTITLTSTGNGNCFAVTDVMVITIQAKPNADFTHTPACLNGPIGFTDISTGSVSTWSWNFGNGTSNVQNPSNTYTATGTQTVTLIVATSAGCADTITRTVFVNPLPTATFSSVSACPDSAAFTDLSTMNPGTLLGWNWTFGDTNTSALQNPTHTYDSAGTYLVTLAVTSDSGCIAVYSDSVTVLDCDDSQINDPVLPSAFTPNGDGHNDFLLVKGGPFKLLELRIFNEWGNEIFRSTDQNIGWDGTFKSKAQPGGSYVWTIDVTTLDDRQIKNKGDVTLIR